MPPGRTPQAAVWEERTNERAWGGTSAIGNHVLCFPTTSAAGSLVLNAIGWLPESFVKVTEDFDRLEAFF